MPAGSLSRQEYPGAEPWVPEDHSIPALEAAAPSCRGCELYRDATQVVMGRGDPHADLMLVGEQPGEQRGPAGQAVRRAGGSLLVGGPPGGWHRPGSRLRHQRGQALPVHHEGQAADPRHAEALARHGLRTLAAGRVRRGPPADRRGSGRDRRAGGLRAELPGGGLPRPPARGAGRVAGRGSDAHVPGHRSPVVGAAVPQPEEDHAALVADLTVVADHLA